MPHSLRIYGIPIGNITPFSHSAECDNVSYGFTQTMLVCHLFLNIGTAILAVAIIHYIPSSNLLFCGYEVMMV